MACSRIGGLPHVGEPVDPREWEDSYQAAIVESPSGLPGVRAPERAFRTPSLERLNTDLRFA